MNKIMEVEIVENDSEIQTKPGLEALLERREKLGYLLEETQAEIKVINEELISYLDENKLKGTMIGDWTVSKATRYSFKTPLAEAKELGAVKETIDNTKLKELFMKGAPITGVNVTNYVLVKQIDKSDS